MSMRAINNIYTFQAGWAPVAVAATKTSASIDFANAVENLILITPGAWTDGTHTFSLTESGDNVNFTAAPAANIVGSFAVISGTASAAAVQKLSYIGQYRWVRIVDTVVGGTTGAILGVQAMVKPRKLTQLT